MNRNEQKTFRMPNLNKKNRNKTTLFMLPALNLSAEKAGFELLKYFGFVNCYIDHKQNTTKCQDCVYLVFNPSKEAIKDFHKFFEVYKSYQNFVDDYVVDRNLIVVVFRVKDKWRSTYTEFKESNYSKMSKEYAEMFKRLDIATGKVYTSVEYFIIHKHKEYRAYLDKVLDVTIEESAELMDKLDLTKEIFDYEFNGGTTEVQSSEGECQTEEYSGSSLHLQPVIGVERAQQLKIA